VVLVVVNNYQRIPLLNADCRQRTVHI
jgi:hypothetical protein